MNMIEVLALQSQISFKDVESTQKFYNEVLEHTTSSNKKTDNVFAYYFVGPPVITIIN